MSSALVRQALEFVDPEESGGKRSKRHTRQSRRPEAPGQDRFGPYKHNKKLVKKETKKDTEQEKIKKLLALSRPTVDSKIAGKIIERAVKGKPLADIVEEKKDDGKSILFPDESFTNFENELFCS